MVIPTNETQLILDTDVFDQEVDRLMEEQQPWTETEWNSPLTTLMVAHAQRRGYDFDLEVPSTYLDTTTDFSQEILQAHPDYFFGMPGRVSMARESTRQLLVVDIAMDLLQLGKSLHEGNTDYWRTNNATSEDILGSLKKWSRQPQLQHLYTNSRILFSESMSREYSISQRVCGLVCQAEEFYRRLTQEEQLQEGLETVLIALAIAVRSKARVPGDHVSHYLLIMERFNARTSQRNFKLRTLSPLFRERFDTAVTEQEVLREAYQHMSPVLKEELQSTVVMGTTLTFLEILERSSGLNPRQMRETHANIAGDVIQEDKVTKLLGKITPAVLANDPSLLATPIRPDLAESYGRPFPHPSIGLRDVTVQRKIETAAGLADTLEQQLDDGSWEENYAVQGDAWLRYELLAMFSRIARHRMEQGEIRIFLDTYQQMTQLLNDKFRDLLGGPREGETQPARIGALFPLQVHEAYPYATTALSYKLITTLTGSFTETTTEAMGVWHGVRTAVRFKALQMLHEAFRGDQNPYYAERIRMAAHAMVGRSEDEVLAILEACDIDDPFEFDMFRVQPVPDIIANLESGSLGRMSPYSNTTVSALQHYMIIEAICSGLPTDNAVRKMSQALEMDESDVTALQVHPNDPNPLDKIIKIFNIYADKLTVRRKTRKYGISSMKKQAVEAAIESITLTKHFQLTMILLFGLASGTSVDGLGRKFLRDETGRQRNPNSREKVAISELFRHLFQPPPRFEQHDPFL